MKKLFFVSILMALFLVHCSNKPKLPKLVVFISIDQGTPSIINKYSHLFSGGYKWFLEHGIKFENAYHEHGITSTPLETASLNKLPYKGSAKSPGAKSSISLLLIQGINTARECG